MSKGNYKISNWSRYNEGLKQRGAITVWINTAVLDEWRYHGERKRGGQKVYSDLAIEVCLTVRKVYHLGYRQTEGFVESFFKVLHIDLPVPDFSLLCRRSATLCPALRTQGSGAITDLVVDASGVKVFGEGEWKVRQYGWGKRRTWMKLHVALDQDSQQVQAVALTTNAVHDATAAAALLSEVKTPIRSLSGDGAYDKAKLRKLLYEKDIFQCIPPHSRAILDTRGSPWLAERNQDIQAIRELGREEWKVVTNYHQRSKAETFMFRYKTIVGASLQSRKTKQQKTEVTLSCNILNHMLTLAKPISQRVA